MTRSLSRWIPAAALLAALALPAARAEDARPGLTLELNRLVEEAAACRFYFLAENRLDREIPELVVVLAFFDKDGVVIDRAGVDLGRLPARKTSLRSVSFANLPCAGLGRVLLDEVVSCGAAPEAEGGCLGLVSLRRRGEVEFFK